MSGKLNNKVAIVTGAGNGIGLAIAEKFASEGAKLILNDLDEGVAEQTADNIRKTGTEVVVCAGDVTASDFGERIVKSAIDAFGAIDIIVNNAGYAWDGVVQKISDEQFDAMLAVHVTAPFRILRAAQPHFKAQALADKEAGREVFRKIVNTSSMAGVYGNPGQSGYAAGKAGIMGLTKTLAKEWGRFKVNVNAVAFGLVHTRMTQALEGEAKTIDVGGRQVNVGIPEAILKGALQMAPFGRGALPEEAAGAVAMLCYPESNHINGQVIEVNGGQGL